MLHNQRESDGDIRVSSHPSYHSRPPVQLQLTAACSKLDGVQGAQLGTVYDPLPKSVPATYDALYDPSDNRADWGGFVSKEKLGKKPFIGHIAQSSGILSSEYGLASYSEKQEWARKRQPGEETNKILRFGNQGIIGGIGCENRWETENQRLTSGAGTRRDQLLLSNQGTPRMRLQDPAQARRPSDASFYSNNPTPRENEPNYGIGDDRFSVSGEGSLIGYRGPSQTKSFIGNMAQSILNSVKDDFAPQTSTAAQPKNVSGAIPGYTGHRRMK